MKLYYFIIIWIILGIILNLINYNYFIFLLSITWYIASILILYLAYIGSKKHRFKQFNFKEIIKSLKSKSTNNISPLSSLCVSLAAKIGVGSLSGVALAIYFGGVGTIFWIIIISLFVSINTYIECLLGMKYRIKIDNMLFGGPSYYIKKYLNDKKLSKLYSILIIICYGILFLSVQVNTIANITNQFNISINYVIIILLIISLFIIIKGIDLITKINNKLVPLMLISYLIIGIYVIISNYNVLPSILFNVIKESLNFRSIISVILIGMQRAIFITESSVGTSAISASMCENKDQGLLEVLGIHITIFLVVLVTFIIIVTSNYAVYSEGNINGIELVLHAFKYHFGNIGSIFLAAITILFALSTIISSYYFGESNINAISNRSISKNIYKILYTLVIIISCFIKAKFLWNLTDYFVAILVIINTSSIIKIYK